MVSAGWAGQRRSRARVKLDCATAKARGDKRGGGPCRRHRTVSVAKHYQFAVFVISIFAVAMGGSRWLGKTLWLNRENLHRKKLGLPTASLFASGGSSEQSFTYTALLQGGLVGLGILGIVLSYVVLMLAFFYFIGDVDGWPRALKGTVGLMIYPVGMLGFIVLIAIVFCKGSNSLFHSIAMFVFVVLCVVAYPLLGRGRAWMHPLR